MSWNIDWGTCHNTFQKGTIRQIRYAVGFSDGNSVLIKEDLVFLEITDQHLASATTSNWKSATASKSWKTSDLEECSTCTGSWWSTWFWSANNARLADMHFTFQDEISRQERKLPIKLGFSIIIIMVLLQSLWPQLSSKHTLMSNSLPFAFLMELQLLPGLQCRRRQQQSHKFEISPTFHHHHLRSRRGRRQQGRVSQIQQSRNQINWTIMNTLRGRASIKIMSCYKTLLYRKFSNLTFETKLQTFYSL